MGFNFIEGTLIDKTNNKEICKVTDIDDSNIFNNEISADEKPKFALGCLTTDIHLENTSINSDLLNSMAESYQKRYKVEFDLPIYIQKRYHKKKRINKKWIKRYGFIEDTVHCKAPIDTMEMASNCDDMVANIEMNFSEIEIGFPIKITDNHKLLWGFK
jgi:hypothetical protein